MIQNGKASGKSFGALSSASIWIDDTARTPGTVRSRAMKLQDKHRLDFLIIDYIQLMSLTKTETRDRKWLRFLVR